VELVRQQLGADKPLPIQFLTYLQRMFQGDLGSSYFSNEPVLKMMLARSP
jgi:ABC-type dipeptide/oligopeptide/nickel transport system permease component